MREEVKLANEVRRKEKGGKREKQERGRREEKDREILWSGLSGGEREEGRERD